MRKASDMGIYRPWLAGLILVMFGALGHPLAWAAFPERPVRILIGFTPGTTGDVLLRLLAPKLSERWGQPVLIDNRPGAGSQLAAEFVAKSVPDGHTLLLSTSANVINSSLPAPQKLDFLTDLLPMTLLAENPVVLVTSGEGSAKNLSDFLGRVRSAPNRMSFASSGNGTFTHLYGELFNLSAGVKLLHVPYKGSTQALADVMSGTVDVAFSPATPVMGLVHAGKLKVLGVIGRSRMNEWPEVPTLAQAGIVGFESALWFGLNAPAGTPPDVTQKIIQDIQWAMSLADIQAQLVSKGIQPLPMGQASFQEVIQREHAQWIRVIKQTGIRAD
jgi:tripartite-type tricarboxylate transporter receptor subunit TctC